MKLLLPILVTLAVGYGTSSGEMGPVTSTQAVTTTDGEKWLDTYSPEEITVRASWYQDRRGNLIVNDGWFEAAYAQDWGRDHAYDDASVNCRQSLAVAPEGSYVICIRPRMRQPVNEPTPSQITVPPPPKIGGH